MEIDMSGIDVDVVSVQFEVSVRDGASLVFVLVGMGVHMCGAVTVRVGVHRVGVVVVSGSIRVGNISVILIRRVDVIAMAIVQMICVGHIYMVVVRRGEAVVVVIAMAHIPVVFVRWVLRGAIQMARTGEVGMISVGGCVGVVCMEHIIEVITVTGVGVIVEGEVAMRVGVIAMVAVAVAVTVEMRRAVRMVVVRRRVRERDVGVRRCIRMRDVGVWRCVRMRNVGVWSISVVIVRGVGVWRCVGVRHVGVRRRVRMRYVNVVDVIVVWRHRRIQVDVQVLDDVVPVRCIAMHIVVGSRCLRRSRRDVDRRHHRHHPASTQERSAREVLAAPRDLKVFLVVLWLVVRSRVVGHRFFPPRR